MNAPRARHQLLHLVRSLKRENPDLPTLEAARVVLVVLAEHHADTFEEVFPLAVEEMHDLSVAADIHHRDGGAIFGEEALDFEAVAARLTISKLGRGEDPEWSDVLAHFLTMLEDREWPEDS